MKTIQKQSKKQVVRLLLFNERELKFSRMTARGAAIVSVMALPILTAALFVETAAGGAYFYKLPPIDNVYGSFYMPLIFFPVLVFLFVYSLETLICKLKWPLKMITAQCLGLFIGLTLYGAAFHIYFQSHPFLGNLTSREILKSPVTWQ